MLKAAIGFDNLLPSAAAQVETRDIGAIPYLDGTLTTKRLLYSTPPLELQYRIAKHTARSDTVVIALHGHASSSGKVFGLGAPDCMRAIGQTLFQRGYDVAGIDLTTDPNRSAYLNGQLRLYGNQIYGLWVRSVCNLLNSERLSDYSRVVLYGLSNGGLIAEHAAALCDGFDLTIVDDIATDWLRLFKKHPTIHATQNYGLFYLTPIWSYFGESDFVSASQDRIVYTRTREKWGELLTGVEWRRVNQLHRGYDREAKANFVFKREPHHIAEIDLVADLLSGGDGVEGYHLVAPSTSICPVVSAATVPDAVKH